MNSRLKQLRINSGMTQEELSSKVNVSRKTISGWENSKSVPDIYAIQKLSNLYNVDIDYILTGEKIDYELTNNKKNRILNSAVKVFFFINVALVVLNIINFITTLFNFSFLLLVFNEIIYISLHKLKYNKINLSFNIYWLYLFLLGILFVFLQIDKLMQLKYAITFFTFLGAFVRSIFIDIGIAIIFSNKHKERNY